MTHYLYLGLECVHQNAAVLWPARVDGLNAVYTKVALALGDRPLAKVTNGNTGWLPLEVNFVPKFYPCAHIP